jgi:hypothetical protein
MSSINCWSNNEMCRTPYILHQVGAIIPQFMLLQADKIKITTQIFDKPVGSDPLSLGAQALHIVS